MTARLFRLAVIIVNLAALVGQSLWMYGQLTDPARPLQHHHKFALLAAVLFSMALEIIGTYLALQAHAARMAEQAAGGLQAGAYAVGAAIAAMNYTHFEGVKAAELGMVLAAFSLANPWLWSIDSRARHRAQLAARGDVDPRGVKLSTDRKLWHPIKSLKVKRHASWSGERNPQRAVEAWEADRSPRPLTATVEVQSQTPALEPVTDPGLIAALDAADRPAIEAPPVSHPVAPPVQSVTADVEESVTETVTETVTRTRTQTRTSRFDAMVTTVTDRVNAVKAARTDWETAGLDYTTIGGIIQRSGRDTIKPVYAVLYRGLTVEEAVTEVLAKNG
jgi:hypothetical protein